MSLSTTIPSQVLSLASILSKVSSHTKDDNLFQEINAFFKEQASKGKYYKITLYPIFFLDKGIRVISQLKWMNLLSFYLKSNRLGNKSCKFLTKASFPLLVELDLSDNFIGEGGLIHLQKAQWPLLHGLSINHLSSKGLGLSWLRKANFRVLVSMKILQDVFMLNQTVHLLIFETKEMKCIEMNDIFRRSKVNKGKWNVKRWQFQKQQMKKLKSFIKLKFKKCQMD